MKGMKKLAALFAAVTAMVLLPGFTTTTVSAEEPATYYVKYMADSDSWRTQKLSTWDSTKENGDMNFVTNNIKDGDLLVIDGDGVKDFTYSPAVHLNNVTIKNVGRAVISADKGIDNCFVLSGSVAAVNGNITNAYVYDNAICNFNNNIQNLYLHGVNKLAGTVTVLGTVGYSKFTEGDRTIYEFYNFAEKSFLTENGIVKTDASKYSTTGTAAPAPAQPEPTPAPAPAPAPTETVTATQPAQPAPAPVVTASSSEYDEVPKTGQNQSILVLALLGMLLLGSGIYTYKKSETICD